MLVRHVSRRQLYLLWCLAWLLAIVLLIAPIGYTLSRATIALSFMAIWAGGLYLWWRRMAMRIAAMSIALVLAIVLMWPSRAIDKSSLRSTYARSLESYLGTTYVWGGENHYGIDCSGLVRQGLIAANFELGIQTLDPALIRQGLAMWWFDQSALALRDGDRGWTHRLARADSINALDRRALQVGDLAATADGQHILAYVGQNRWIEADPGYQRVIAVRAPDLDNLWFRVPIYVLRWHQLQ